MSRQTEQTLKTLLQRYLKIAQNLPSSASSRVGALTATIVDSPTKLAKNAVLTANAILNRTV
jgi:hypothetical protein